MNIQRINPQARWSDVTVFNSIAHFVEIADDTSVNVAQQTQQIFQQAEQRLESIHSDKSRILSATIYLTDLAHLADFNKAWEDWLPDGCAPSRACLKVELVDPSFLVEIAFVAAA